jgi:hypothetical protein
MLQLGHGDLTFLRVPNALDPIPDLINLLDRSTYEHSAYSHAGLLYQDSPDTRLLSLRPNGLLLEGMGETVTKRGALTIWHPAGPDAIEAAMKLRTEPVPFDVQHLLLAAVAAILRARGCGRRARDQLWEYIHGVSRSIVEVKKADCEHPIVPGDKWRHWFCASFVDHAFRLGGTCLDITEPEHPRTRRLAYAIVTFCRLVALVRRWTEEGFDAMARMYVMRSVAQAGDGLAADPVVATTGDTLEPPEAAEVYEDIAADPTLVEEQGSDLETAQGRRMFISELQWAIDVFRGRNEPPADGHTAPAPGQPVWPPFMSLSLMIDQVTAAPNTTSKLHEP